MLTRLTQVISIGWLFCITKIVTTRSEEIFGSNLELAPKLSTAHSDIITLTDNCAKIFSVKSGEMSRSTTLWFFGEHHNRFEETILCVEEITANTMPHTIYVEDFPANMVIPCEKIGFQQLPDRTCIGWDDVQSSREISRILMADGVENLIAFLENYYANGMTSKWLDNILKELSINKNFFQLASQRLLNLRSKNETYQKIFSRKIDYILPPITTEDLLEVKRLCTLRNTRITEIMEGKKIREFGVFIAGKAHLEKKNQNGVNDTCASNHINKSLQESKHRNNYVILTMDN